MRTIALFIAAVISGCGSASNPQTLEKAIALSRPMPSQIIGFKANPPPAHTYFKDFDVKQDDLEEVLASWQEVSEEKWAHGYSHVAGEDRTGTITLSDDRVIAWLVRPGGLATLTFPDGRIMYFAKDYSPFETQLGPWQSCRKSILASLGMTALALTLVRRNTSRPGRSRLLTF